MANKANKRATKQAKREAREAARRRERQRTVQTGIVVGIIVLIGGVLIFTSVERPADDVAEDPLAQLSEEATADPAATEEALPQAEPCVPEEPPADALADGESKDTYDAPDDVLEDGVGYRATVATSCGDVVFELFAEDAPETVNSFVFLAQDGFFDGLRIFRNATSIAALQTGAGDDTNTWDLGYTLPDEFARAEAEGGYGPGALAMAKSAAPDSAGSQFFMVYDQSSLPPEYTLFGQVVEGLDVLASIGAIPTAQPDDPANEEPSQDVFVETVTIAEVDAADGGDLLEETATPGGPGEGVDATEAGEG